MNESLTVLMTTYNCAPFLSQSIHSILNQTYKNFELLLIDDGSSDNTEQVANRFKDGRIRYLKRKHYGRSAALNFGLKKASFDIIALMDADDISHPNRLETQLKSYDFGYSSISSTWSLYFKNKNIIYSVKTPVSDQLLKKKLFIHSFICNPSVIYNRKFILENKGYSELLETFEEYDLWLRIKNETVFQVIPEYLLFMRIRPESLSRKDSKIKRNIIYEIQKKHLGNDKEWLSLSKNERTNTRGWQTFFYGKKQGVKNHWVKDFNKLLFKPKMLIALLITYFPNSIFLWFREGRFRLKISFFFEKLFVKKIKSAIAVFNAQFD
jgi:glycosyltransferase involved in cell wall biosynthesis